MITIPSIKLIQRWFSVIVSCGVVLILFFVFCSYIHPKAGFWPNNEAAIIQHPGEYVKQFHPNPLNRSYCKFNFALPENFTIFGYDIHGTPEEEWDSSFRVVYHVLEAENIDHVPLVTYATHLTYEFLDYIPEIVRYWDGFVSAAVFLPDGDSTQVLEKIVHYCYCIPSMSRLSLHFVFPKDSGITNRITHFDKDAHVRCDICINCQQKLRVKPTENKESWYPVNVCRNVARNAAFTEYILVSDAELIPSKELAFNFLKMLNSYRCSSVEKCYHMVYVLPVFEIESVESIPRSKTQLLDLVNIGKAVYFHQLICTHCQKFPGLSKWLESDPGDVVKPFVTTKRQTPFHRWEPIYIGTKNEPLYNEALSWEGFQDKMLQMLEMCLIGYRFVILDGAFLVHWPGIKRQKTQEPWRRYYINVNQKRYDEILDNITASYPPNHRCQLKN